MRAVIRVLLVLSASSLSACAHSPLRTELSCPRRAGPPWIEYQSVHFDLFSDLPSPEAIGLVSQLERTYRAFLDATGWRFAGHGEPPGRMRLVAFERMVDYSSIGPPHTDGFFVSRALDGEPLTAITLDGPSQWRSIFLHELTHRLLRYHVPNAPLWLHEGLAQFFSTFDMAEGKTVVGRPPPIALSRRIVSAADLFAWETESGVPDSIAQALYGASWFLVDALMTDKRRELGEALQQMAAGATVEQAFAAVFGLRFIVDLDALERAQAGRERFTVWHASYAPAAIDDDVQTQVPLDDAEVHLLWARALPERSPELQRQLGLALQHGTVSAEYLFLRGQEHAREQELTAAERDLAAAVHLRPEDERYRVALAELHIRDAQTGETPGLKQAIDGDLDWLGAHARSPRGLALLALGLGNRGELTEARRRVARALELDPTNVMACVALSEIAYRQGDIDVAFDYARRALHMAPTGSGTAAMRVQVEKLRQLRALRERRLNGATLSDVRR